MPSERKPTLRVTFAVAMSLTVALTAIAIILVNDYGARSNALASGMRKCVW